MTSPLEIYLREVATLHQSGLAQDEPPYYGYLAKFLDAIGMTLQPAVQCVVHPKNRGAGFPDGGLFTKDQIARGTAFDRLRTIIPARGVLEVKAANINIDETVKDEQVLGYLDRYRQVLVTNFWRFLLVVQEDDGRITSRGEYKLADDEAAFWRAAAHPAQLALEHSGRLTDFLQRAMLLQARLGRPEDVAAALATYAREARGRLEQGSPPALRLVRTALDEALGLNFEGGEREDLFRSTLIQTLFYGLFAAWVLWAKDVGRSPSARFDWRAAAYSARFPVISTLFYHMTAPDSMAEISLVDLLDQAAETLNRVDQPAFFGEFGEETAVQYFYEPFLAAFDPVMRKQLGVWYTPRSVARYMVERVDTVLREQLGLPEGFADPDVFVLDPCCGTGTFILEVIDRISRPIKARGDDVLVPHKIKEAVLTRVFGFEILPAPFVVAHLQIGLIFQALGAPIATTKGERASVYLTNALTGWEPSAVPRMHPMFPDLEKERDAAELVKRKKPILVVIGNPPYNAFAGVSGEDEVGLVEPYKEGLRSEWKIRKFNLDDLFVRFFRLAERRITEQTGRGVVCYISNYSYLDEMTLVRMRQRFLAEFDAMWFDSLNGDSRDTGKRTPDGRPDPSIFASKYNRVGIRKGVAIGLMVRTRAEGVNRKAVVRVRQLWGAGKQEQLIATLDNPAIDALYAVADPKRTNRFSFLSVASSRDYEHWPSVVDLCAVDPISGLAEKRRGALIDMDDRALAKRMARYYDATLDWPEFAAEPSGLTENAGRFDAKSCRQQVQRAAPFNPDHVRRYTLFPFDTRWCYWSDVRPLWNEPRPALAAQAWPGNRFLIVRPSARRPKEGLPVWLTPALPDHHLLDPNVVAVPLRLRHHAGLVGAAHAVLTQLDNRPQANLSPKARRYLEEIGLPTYDQDEAVAESIWMHALAVICSPHYLSAHTEGIRRGYPRIPLPDTADALRTSAALGSELADLMDTTRKVDGVTSGKTREELACQAVLQHRLDGPFDPDEHLVVRASWGSRTGDGPVMPGEGKLVEHAFTGAERTAIAVGGGRLGLTPDDMLAVLGERAYDVYLNDRVYWSCIPEAVWTFRAGGYREYAVLRRPLSTLEEQEFRDMVRRIAAILLLQPRLDDNYEAVEQSCYPWSPSAASTTP